MNIKGKQSGGSARCSRKSSAFTLIELMVSMAILGLIMVMLFAIFDQINKAWLQGENRVETFTQARAILDLMSREMSQAVATPKISFYGKDANNVYFVAPLNTVSSNQADLCEVGYEFVPATATLTRKITEPTALNISGGIWDFYTNPTWWNSFDPNRTFVLANNSSILNITFEYLDANGNSIAYAGPTNGLPYAISISLNAVDSRAATRLKLVGGGNIQSALLTPAGQSIANSAQRPFSTLIYMPNTSP